MTFFRNPSSDPYRDVPEAASWMYPAEFRVVAVSHLSSNPSVSLAVNFRKAQQYATDYFLGAFYKVSIYEPNGELCLRMEKTPRNVAECNCGCGNFGDVNPTTGVAICDECEELYSPVEGGRR